MKILKKKYFFRLPLLPVPNSGPNFRPSRPLAYSSYQTRVVRFTSESRPEYLQQLRTMVESNSFSDCSVRGVVVVCMPKYKSQSYSLESLLLPLCNSRKEISPLDPKNWGTTKQPPPSTRSHPSMSHLVTIFTNISAYIICPCLSSDVVAYGI